jgi:hypothetical protein
VTYKPSYLPDGRKAYNPSRTERDIHDEWAAFEQQLRDAGETDPMAIYLKARELWRQEEQAGERWGEWQQRVWHPRNAAAAAARPNYKLTLEEWAYLAEHFEGANHPLAISIQGKATHHVELRTV